jgi:hypothetical protein
MAKPMGLLIRRYDLIPGCVNPVSTLDLMVLARASVLEFARIEFYGIGNTGTRDFNFFDFGFFDKSGRCWH